MFQRRPTRSYFKATENPKIHSSLIKSEEPNQIREEKKNISAGSLALFITFQLLIEKKIVLERQLHRS